MLWHMVIQIVATVVINLVIDFHLNLLPLASLCIYMMFLDLGVPWLSVRYWSKDLSLFPDRVGGK